MTSLYKDYSHPDFMGTATMRAAPKGGSGCYPWVTSTNETVLLHRSGSYRASQIPGFNKRKASGALLPHGYYCREDLKAGGVASASFSTGATGSCEGYTGTISTIGVVPSRGFLATDVTVWRSVNRDAMLQEALADCLPALDALTSLAESRKTVDMITGCARQARALIIQGRKGGFSSAQAAGKAWLQYRYGWRTLGMDIENAVEAYNNPLRPIVITGTASTKSSITETYNGVRYGLGGGPWPDLAVVGDQTVTTSLSVKARVDAMFTARSINALASPVVTAWELVPYSFVADWFVTVGTALKAWQVAMSAQYVASISSSYEEKHALNIHDLDAAAYWNFVTHAARGSGSLDFKRLMREPVGNISLIPVVNVHLTGKRVLDAAALCIGLKKLR